MGIRESLNQNPAITTGVTIGIIVAALFWPFPRWGIVWQLFGSDDMPGEVTEMYYTTDDGANYFADDVHKLSPFTHDGKEAVRCYVYTCDNGKTKFVAYLERLTQDAKKKMEAAQEALKKADPNQPPPPGTDTEIIQQEGTEVKKPGDAKWVKRNTPEGDKIIQPTCPDGKNENLNIVLPND